MALVDNGGPITGPYKVSFRIEKWSEDQDPETDAPYDDETTESWHEPDGSEITDPNRIAELERSIKE